MREGWIVVLSLQVSIDTSLKNWTAVALAIVVRAFVTTKGSLVSFGLL